jgi:hypothetical protein
VKNVLVKFTMSKSKEIEIKWVPKKL